MAVYWLEQCAADAPADDDWLGAAEALRLSTLRFPKRRADWRLGRWTAKCAVASYLELSPQLQRLADIEIRPAPSGAPEVWLANQLAPVAISLSHREGIATCAVAPSGTELGCDLEIIEPRSDAFVADYFTSEEQFLIARAANEDRWLIVALLWSAKESALKAMQAGLRLDTRSVTVKIPVAVQSESRYRPLVRDACQADLWQPMTVQHGAKLFFGWWQQNGNRLRTLVARPRPDPPIVLAQFSVASRTA